MENKAEVLTMEDIYNAMRLVENLPRGTWKVEDAFKVIHISYMGIQKIEFKPLGKKMINKFIDDNKPEEGKVTNIEEIYGIKVVVSNNVKKERKYDNHGLVQYYD